MAKIHLLLLVVGAGSIGRAADEAVAQTMSAARPNILIAIADDWSYGHAGAYGCSWVKTPAFDRLAKEGLLFTRAYTPNAKCAPSRAAILTGRNSWQLEEAANHYCYFPLKFKTVFESLGEQGYFTGHTAKGWQPGTATNALGKPRALVGRAFNARTAKPSTKGIGPNDYAANFAGFLDAAPTNAPFCFWFGSLEPHRDYEYGSGAAKGGKKVSDVDRVPGYWPDNEIVRNDMLDYAFEVEHYDRHLGRMLAELKKRGLLENTIVIATSDHGMPFPRVKGQEYENSNHVPLAVCWPGGIRRPGRTVDDFVSFIDLAPTLIETAGLKWEETGMASVTGRSLREIFDADSGGQIVVARDHVLIGKERHDIGRPDDVGYPIRGIRKGDWLYLANFETNRWPASNPETGYLNCDGGATKTFILDARRKSGYDQNWNFCFGKRPAEEFYNVKADPDCLKNLANQSDVDEVKAAMRTQLLRELEAQHDPRMAGQGSVFDRYPYAGKEKDFYNRYIGRGEKFTPSWIEPTDIESQPVKP